MGTPTVTVMRTEASSRRSIPLEQDEQGDEARGRVTCYVCFRPKAVCYCDAVRPISHRTRVVIVQHPREEFHPLNTARVAERCLTHAEVLRGDVQDLDAAFRRLELPERTALLYPSRDAVDVGELSPAERPECIVVIDGTWNQARVLNRRMAALAALPRVRFTPPSPSEYRIRREPRADYLSTVESIALMLESLEPEGFDVERLRATFRTMIDRNVVARQQSVAAPRQKSPRPERRTPLPEALLGHEEGIVVVYAEGAPDPDGKLGKHPFIVCAGRLAADGLDLCAVLKAPFRPHDIAREAHALTEQDLQGALSLPTFSERFSELCRPGDVVVAWNDSSLSVLADALGGSLSARGVTPLALKSVYCNARGRDIHREALRRGGSERVAWGSLGDITRREGIAVSAAGRAPRRLEETRAVLRLLRERELSVP
jgi:DTW domain-containing protein YfiP